MGARVPCVWRMSSEPDWQARFRAARMSLPMWAWAQPSRNAYVSNASGVFEIYRWDRDTALTEQITDRAAGTHRGAIDPSGEWVWWFDDADGSEFGTWRRTPFGGGASQEAVVGLAPSYSSGLCLGLDGLSVVGCSTDAGASVYATGAGGNPVLLYAHPQDASVSALSRDGALVAIEHSEHGDSRHMALRVLRVADGSTVAELWDGPGLGLDAVSFAPVVGDTRMIARHERLGRWTPFIWDVATCTEHPIEADLPGDVSAQWFADASALLIAHDHHARTSLFRLELSTGSLEPLDIPPGTISGATARPDGVVEYLWSSGAEPSVVLDSTSAVVIRPPGPIAASSVAADDAWVDGATGPIHALISKPAGAATPLPTLFMVHGGPASHDADAFSPAVAAWVDAGFAVVRVNYRGSTGYGSAWRDAIEHRVGLTELDDLIAVRDWAVSSGLTDAGRVVLGGDSWGGYLTLLGLGVTPGSWSVGIAGVPVADYLAAYDDEMEALRAFDRALFGGSPDEVPDRYERSSPITYVDDVTSPLLIIAGANDPRCPIRQIDNYVERLRARAFDVEVYRFDAGHGTLVIEERINQVAAQLDFARRHLAQPRPTN